MKRVRVTKRMEKLTGSKRRLEHKMRAYVEIGRCGNVSAKDWMLGAGLKV